MITEKELLEGIAECQGQRNPNANTCLKLASFYTILDHIKEKQNDVAKNTPVPVQTYSFAPEPYRSKTEFGNIIQELDTYDVLEIMDELMTTLLVVQPRLYASVLRKLKGQR